MFGNIKWLRLVPDRPGRGGTKTGIHSFQQEPINDIRSLTGGHVYRRYWRRDFDTVLYPNPQTTDAGSFLTTYAIHGYVYPSLTDPSAQPSVTILSHHLAGGGATSRIWDFSAGTLRATRPGFGQPAVFQNIAGRCFLGDGTTEAMILDDRTPAIHAQPNQNLGIGTPGQALQSTNGLPFNAGGSTASAVPNLTGYGFAYIFNTHGATPSYLHTPDPDSQIANIKTTDTVTVQVINPSYAAITGAPPASGFPAIDGRTSNTSPAVSPFIVGTDTISCASGSSIVTKNTAWTVPVAGLAINFNGFSFLLGPNAQDPVGDRFDGNGTLIALDAFQAVIYGVYDGPTVTNVNFTITGSHLDLNATNTLSIPNNVLPAGYAQATRSALVPVMVSATAGSADLWFTESNSARIAKITTAGVVTEFTVSANPTYITADSNGDLWTSLASDNIARVTPTGVETDYPIPPPPATAPQGIVVGPDGAIWFCEQSGDAIGRLSPSGTFTIYPIPTAAALAQEITVGGDGNLWFTETGSTKIGRITMAGVVTEFDIGTAPQGICFGPDGNVWFTEPVTNRVGVITPAGVVTTFGAGITALAGLEGITAGPDGNLWFCENTVNQIGQITPAGVVTEFACGAGPRAITTGPDGNLWFTENGATRIGTMTTAGVLTEFAAGITGTGLTSITSGAAIQNLGNITLSGEGPSPISPVPIAGPTYAYAWYDPETGHMSNISPLTKIAAPPAVTPSPDIRNYQNVTPYFRIDPGSISYPTGIDATRFSHVMFFRTLSTPGSSTLYPIGSLMPFVGKVHPGAVSTLGSWHSAPLHGWFGQPNAWVNGLVTGASPNYFFDFSRDSDLLLSGGFRAPQFTNEKPMVLLRGGATQPGYPYLLAYWDRRTWIVNTQEPDVLAYSCDEAQCPLGVPTEAFPPGNRLRIPDVDAKGIGLKTVGDMLLLTTERQAYIVAGNNESNYRLMKISSSMPGVGTYQMDEFPTVTGAEGEPTTVFFLGRDRKVYQWTVGNRVIPISDGIQDQLDTYLSVAPQLTTYQQSRVHCVSAWGRRLVVVSVPLSPLTPSTLGFPTFIYDIDNQVWSTTYRTSGTAGSFYAGIAPPMTTVYGLNIPANEIYSIYDPTNFGLIKVLSWLRDDTAASSLAPFDIVTFPMNFDGKKTRKRLVSVNLHATNGTWGARVFVNEIPYVAATFAAYPDPLTSIYGAGAVPVDGPLSDLVAFSAQFSPNEPLIGYRFGIQVQKADLLPGQAYAIDVAYQDWEEPSEGEP